MLETARADRRGEPPHAGIELALHAEGGGRPARRRRLRPHAPRRQGRLRLRPGRRRSARSILGAPTRRSLEVTFHGRAAHAGMAPEEGRSAIAAAARAIADLRLGRIDEETTRERRRRSRAARRATSSPSAARSSAEARSHDEREARRARRRRCSTRARSPRRSTDCEVETRSSASYRGYRFRRDDEPVRLARDGAPRVPGIEPRTALSRRRRRRERLQRARARAASTSRTAWRRSTRPTSTSPSPTSTRWSTSRSRSSRRRVALSLRRGAVTAVLERHEGLVRLEVDGAAVRRLPAADRAGRARRRGGRQHAGARCSGSARAASTCCTRT